MYSLVENLED